MSTYVLIPGAGGDAWYWHRLGDMTAVEHPEIAPLVDALIDTWAAATPRSRMPR